MTKYKGSYREAQCEVCKGNFKTTAPNVKYCGDKCRMKGAKEKRKEWEKRTGYSKEQNWSRQGKCEYCGKEYKRIRSYQKYCSKHCGNEMNKLQKRKSYQTRSKYRKCEYCKEKFEPMVDGAKIKYCSDECAKNMRRKRNRERWRKENPGWNDDTRKKCENCNEWFEVPARNSWIARYCGYECRYEHKARAKGVLPIEEHLEQIARQKEENERARAKEREKRRGAVSCTECGVEFITYNKQQITCTEECSRRRRNRLAWQRESGRLNKNNIVDRDISLRVLYKRDGGECYICGEQCDFDDHSTDGGHFTSGPRYPSIDHIVPIARGGKHAWDNVKLAHHRCNSLKSDQLPSEFLGRDIEIDIDEAYALARTPSANKKTVEQYTKEGKLIEVYDSTVEASRQTGIPSSTIQNNARGQSKVTRGKYVFRYAP